MTDFIEKIEQDFPAINFVESDTFKWSPDEKAVYFDSNDENAQLATLHEIGHALLQHDDFTSDLDLINKELQAWEKALDLADSYLLEVNEDFIEECMETYRNWLHQRSICPKCQHNVFQGKNFTFKCQNCSNEWQVEADQYCSL